MSSFTPARPLNTTLNEADRAKKWSNKRANKIMDKAYSFEDAEMFGSHLEGELFNVCFDLESANNSNAVLEGTMRTMQKELAELREFKEMTENTLSSLGPVIAGVFNYEQKEMKRDEKAAKKAAAKKATAPKKASPKCVQQRFGSAPHARRACTKNSKFKGFYSGM